jgi:predicted dehydrogenase
MESSRRKFIYRTGTLAAGSYLLPSTLLSSCQPWGNARQVRMGFIGPEEHFKQHQSAFRKLKNAKTEFTSLEDAMKSDLHAVFLDVHPNMKAVNIILLFEAGKDVVTPYPMANGLDEYKRIQEYMSHFDRRLGMLNPLHFYPAVRTLKDWLEEETRQISEIRLNCHPRELVSGYLVSGFAGAVQPLQRMVSFITGKFPVSLLSEDTEYNDIRRYILDYESFQAIVQTDPKQTGWIMELEGPQLKVLTDHTGLLKLNHDVEPRIPPSNSVWTKAMIKNLEDFLRAVRSRNEPAVNSIDGLASIILNQAAERSIHMGTSVDL